MQNKDEGTVLRIYAPKAFKNRKRRRIFVIHGVLVQKEMTEFLATIRNVRKLLKREGTKLFESRRGQVTRQLHLSLE